MGSGPERSASFERWESSRPTIHAQRPNGKRFLAADDAAPAKARRAVRALTRAFAPQCRDDADLLVTEVVSNAVLHGPGAAIEVCFWVRPGTLDVLVVDGGGGFVPPPPTAGTRARGGRGLPLLDALALHWGSSVDAPGAVWFQLATLAPES